MRDWDWQLYPEAESMVFGLVRSFLDGNTYANMIRGEIENTSSTRFIDWVDSMEIPDTIVSGQDLQRIGYIKDSKASADGAVFNHPGAFFPIILRADGTRRLSICVDDLDRFLLMGHLTNKEVNGQRNAPFRTVELNREGDNTFCGVERHGGRTYDVVPGTDLEEYGSALKVLLDRKREYDDDELGIEDFVANMATLGDGLEKPRLADAFFRSERTYWQSKNRAGAVQFKRQESMGLGWGNHDHHTFRCSRENFGNAVEIFESMGMTRRERFFAGAEAGWGAQVMEQPESGMVVFADVDLGPDEGNEDFVNQGLEPLERIGTVGLWVGLHGESLLSSGMHHLAVGSDFPMMREDLRKRNVPSMAPFSNFEFLKQSFTEPEHWMPMKARVEHLLKEGLITENQAGKFKEQGTVGSHMEIIQRDQGFKGFNQSSVSAIIRLTDPLKRNGTGA